MVIILIQSIFVIHVQLKCSRDARRLRHAYVTCTYVPSLLVYVEKVTFQPIVNFFVNTYTLF